MRVAAIDLGAVRVGLAISDELGMLAHPRPPLPGKDMKKLLALLRRIAADEHISRFVVGLPLHMTGDEGKGAHRVRRFAQSLADATGREVELFDERWTTVEAARKLRDGEVSSRASRGKIDGASATILLQAWLDREKAV